jgi:hypothetical protein
MKIREAIHRCINSNTLSYRYVLPTQLLAKAVDPALDCRIIQKKAGLPGAFDARSLCHRVIVPFDRAHHNVLGGSKEPYLNNPLRIPGLLPGSRAAQKNKAGFDDLCMVLDFAQSHADSTGALLACVLLAIRDRMERVQIVYPVPNRASAGRALVALQQLLAESSGGLRLQVVAVALFRTIGEYLRLYVAVRSASVNAADESTGLVADIECVDEADNVVLAAEVKDRQLVLTQVQDKLPGIRERGIRELLFLVQGGVAEPDRGAVAELSEQQFATGQNIYVCEFGNFLDVCLVLLGESGRRVLLKHIGAELDAQRADLVHRSAWRDLLASM